MLSGASAKQDNTTDSQRLLIAIIPPSLSRRRNATKRMACGTNLKGQGYARAVAGRDGKGGPRAHRRPRWLCRLLDVSDWSEIKVSTAPHGHSVSRGAAPSGFENVPGATTRSINPRERHLSRPGEEG